LVRREQTFAAAEPAPTAGDEVAAGAGAGALLGGLAGLALFVIPGIGPVAGRQAPRKAAMERQGLQLRRRPASGGPGSLSSGASRGGRHQTMLWTKALR